MRILRDLIILISLFALVWYGFSLWVEPKSQSELITVEEEEEISDMLNDYILADFKIYRDSTYNVLLDSVTNRLRNNLDSPLYNYQFRILDESEVNAFCSFSGRIYIFRGLIESCEKPEELAAVLAHELGHGQKRHVVKNLIRELGIATISVILSGGDQVVIEQIARVVISSSFTRKMEKEADDFAYELLQDAHINPQTLTAFFIKMKSEQNDSFAPQWLSSHPSLENRIDRLAGKKKREDFTEVKIDVPIPEKQESPS